MEPASLTAWRLRLGLNKVEAARRLGLARNTLEAYESGANRIPLYIALACAALSYGLPPYPGWQAPRAKPASGDKWEPIETAPRDGTKILACGVGAESAIVWFVPGKDHWTDGNNGWSALSLDSWQPLPSSKA